MTQLQAIELTALILTAALAAVMVWITVKIYREDREVLRVMRKRK